MTCSFEGCGREIRSRGYCKTHYEQWRRRGTLSPVTPHGDGTISKGYRYLYIPDHPNAEQSGRIAEHRKVMSDLLGRPLLDHENVHHINGNKLDNRPENLELWVTKQPYGQRVTDLVVWAKEILQLYGQ